MGPLFVVIVWVIIAGVLSAGAAVLALVLNLRKPRALLAKRTAFAAVLPVFAIGWAGCSVVSFAIWSSVTGMHLGFGNFADFSEVPLSDGYSVWMIDTDAEGSIHKGGSGAPVISGVREIGQEGNVVFGRSDDGFFTLDTQTGQLKERMANAEYGSTLKNSAISTPALVAVGRFYTGRRWNLLDSGLVAALIASPILLVVWIWHRFMRSGTFGAAEPPHAPVTGRAS